MKYLSILALVFLFSCANIEHTTNASKPLNEVLLAGVGDLIFRIERERNLENAFGKSDLFGRKTKEGYTEVRFAGTDSDGSVVLYRKDVKIMTNETTMSRTPLSTTSGNSTSVVSGTATTRGAVTSVRGVVKTHNSSITTLPADDFHIIIPTDTIPIRLNSDEKMFPVEGFIVEVIDSSRNSLRYRISKNPE